MNWTSELNSELSFPSPGGFLNTNYQFQGSTDFPLKCAKETSFSYQRKYDQTFINNFILSKQKSDIFKNESTKISTSKNFLLGIIYEKKQVEDEVLRLNVNDENFDTKCEEIMAKIQKMCSQISKFDSDIKPYLAMELKKRLKKRNSIKKRKAHKKLVHQKIQEKHKMIDMLLLERSDEAEMVKHEAALKRQADTVLHEVRGKKFEAKKMLNLLIALSKLRLLRSKEEEKLGGYCSKKLTETFNKVMKRFQNLWEKQLEVYKLEEKGLKIMLEENTVPVKKNSKLETILLQWEKVLFGSIRNDENEKLLTLPEHDIEALVRVRRDWDQFLTSESTPVASSIPLGWVLPPEPSDQWKAFTK